jgi:FAD/FMN-containing dehydrogenase
MKRRAFCTAGLAALAATSLPYRRLWGAPAADIQAVGLDGQQLSLKPADIDELRAALRGELLTAADAGYDGARLVWNAAFDRKPALIARCAGSADVMRAVSFAAARGLLTAVRGGGHSLSGQSGCDGGLVVDVSPMRSVRVDPKAKLARVEAGALLGQLDREAQAFGLATTAGTATDTGVAGLTLGGGVGRIGRKFGLACDNLTAADVVTADGKFVRASHSENPDLLWALQGGGGNFGVVTGFEYRLHALGPMLFGGSLSYPLSQARAVLRGFAEFIASAPDELYVDVDLSAAGSGPGRLDFDVCYCGSPAEAERVAAPLRKLGKPQEDHLAAATYVKLQGATDPPAPNHMGIYIKGGLVDRLTPALIDAVIDYLEGAPGAGRAVVWQHQGGAISRVDPRATAYWNRKAVYNVMAFAMWPVPGDGAQPGAQWVRGAWSRIEPFTNGYYVNLHEQEDHARRIQAAYGDNYPRLAALKKRYDPTNLFRLNANIKPAA